MCGIAGVFHADPARPIDPENLVSMAAIQFHRGPDGFGWHSMADRGVGFSHARLTIINLHPSGCQPFVNADNDLMMAHNGEFYDYQRIRADLTARGEKFRTKSDSEIILHLYPRAGLDGMLPHLRGEFSFALYDKNTDELHLVRDRFGIKPLYYAVHNDTLLFGSEIKAIFAYPGMPRKFSKQGVYHQLMQTIVPGSTPYEGVHQIKPGHVLTIKRVNKSLELKSRPYWDADFPQAEEHRKPFDENDHIEAVRAKLLDAIQQRQVADVKVGCYLSGGIDSCCILGLSAAARQDPVKAFTISFDNKEYDESDIAKEMAESVAADQDILKLNATHLYRHFEETHWHTERTIYNTLGVAKLLMSRHVHQAKYKVVVTGEGSDELFAGYPSFRKDMFNHGLGEMSAEDRAEWEQMLQESNKLFRGAMLSEQEVSDPALNSLCGFTPSCLQPWLACAPRVPGLLSPDWRKDLKGYSPGEAIAAQFDPAMLEGRHPLDKAQYVWIKTMLEGQILTWGGDRVDMANSMEARPAFLDHHLAERAFQVPPQLRIKGRKEKYVLREAVKGVLPKVLYEREKFAFMAPPAHTDEAKMKELMKLADTHLSEQAIADSQMLDPDSVQSLIKEYKDPNTPRPALVQLDAIFNHLLGVQILYRDLLKRDIPELARQRAKQMGWSARPS